jgi:hypothetical protein
VGASADSPLLRPVAISAPMPLPDLTDDERAELVRLVRDAIDGDKYFLSPRAKRLRSILEKLDPASGERAVTPYPAPRPRGEPSLLLTRKRGRRR